MISWSFTSAFLTCRRVTACVAPATSAPRAFKRTSIGTATGICAALDDNTAASSYEPPDFALASRAIADRVILHLLE